MCVCGDGKTLGIAACFNNVVAGRQGHTLCEVFCISFLKIISLSLSGGESGHLQLLGILRI